MGKEYKYSAFISYARQDRKFAAKLENDLQRYILPKAEELLGEKGRRRPFPAVFRDESRLVPGTDLPARIRYGLENAEFLIVVCSPAAVTSEWVKKEIIDFIGFGGEERVLAVVVGGEPNTEKNGKPPESEALPTPLRFLVKDGAITDAACPEPFWVDWRGQKHGDRLNFLRLVAALLSFEDLDTLIRGDHERVRTERRRSRQIIAGVSVLTVAAAISAVGALEQRQQAFETQSRLLAKQANELPVNDPARLLLAIEALPSVQGALFPRRDIDVADRSVITAASYVQLLNKYRTSHRFAALSPDGNHIATVSADRTLQLWDTRTGAQEGAPEKLQSPVDGLSIVPIIGVVVPSKDVAFPWREVTNEPPEPAMNHGSAVTEVVLSPDGSRFVTSSQDGTVKLWNARSHTQIGVPMRHKRTVVRMYFSSDGNRIVTASTDGTARIWNAHNGMPLGLVMGHDTAVSDVIFAPGGQRIMTITANGTVRQWQANSGVPQGNPKMLAPDVIDAFFFVKGNRILTVSTDYVVRLWDSHTGAQLNAQFDKAIKLDGDGHVSVSSDGTRIATFSSGDAVRLWDGRTGAPLSLRGKTDNVLVKAVISSSAESISTARMRPQVNARTGRLDMRKASNQSVYNAFLCPNGSCVVLSLVDGSAQLWDTRTGALLATLMDRKTLPSSVINGADFFSDGSRLVTATADGAIRLWDARTGAPLRVLMEPRDLTPFRASAMAVAVSADGQRIISGNADGSIRLFDGGLPPLTGTGKELAQQACALLPSNMRDFSATPELRILAQKNALDRDMQRPCHSYGLLSHHYWFLLARNVGEQLKNWTQLGCTRVGLCKQSR
jgi:WD40 repeat protein